MNERIKELWEESQQWNGSDDGRGGLKIHESVEKFAELIVQECVKSLWTEECRISDLASEEYTRGSNKIKKHFGVEQ
jgi:hypothetical protein